MLTITRSFLVVMVVLTIEPVINLLDLPALPSPIRSPNETTCESKVRILNDALEGFKRGAIACKGNQLIPRNQRQGNVLCLTTGQTIKISTKTPINERLCSSELVVKQRSPTRGRHTNEIVGIRPLGNTLTNKNPNFSWTPVAGADRYSITLSSGIVGWTVSTQDHALMYPTNQAKMLAGKTYRFLIRAWRGDDLISTSFKSFHVLTDEEASTLQLLVKQVSALPVSADELAYQDLNSIYTVHGLLNEAIQTIEARIKAGGRHPGLFRALGNHYLQAELLREAQKYYRTGNRLARQTNNTSEINKTQAGLIMVEEKLKKQSP